MQNSLQELQTNKRLRLLMLIFIMVMVGGIVYAWGESMRQIELKEKDLEIQQLMNERKGTWSEKIILEPKDAAKFKKTVQSEDKECGTQKGLVTYDYNNVQMIITNKNLPVVAAINKSSLDAAKKFIMSQDAKRAYNEGNTADSNQFSPLPAFYQGCGGGYSLFLGELKGIEYKNVDSFKVIYTEEGQGIGGAVYVRVFAQKGDNLIMLGGSITGVSYEEDKYYDKFRNACAKNSDLADFDSKCYQDKLRNDSDIQSKVKAKAQELVNTFAL